MRSDHPRARTRQHILSPTLIALTVLACSGDSHVGCSPTLTCTLNEARFEPPAAPDAGPEPCASPRRCRATQVAAGGEHTCALARAGELFCWGSDADGQVGGTAFDDDAGSDEGSAEDAGVLLVLGVTQATAGAAHTCALEDEGIVRCWGRNADGQVDGVATDAPVRDPTPVAIDAATQIEAGDAHTCAVIERGVTCWGSARFGQVGREVADRALAPGLVAGTEGAVEVAAGARHSCARLRSGRVLCWGELIDADDGEPHAHSEPVVVSDLDDATQLAAGAGHSCALRANGEVVCWGRNDSGQLGDGTTTPSATPVTVEGLELALHLSAGGFEHDGQLVGHSCTVTKSFFVACWGRNAEGQLGIGRAEDSPQPAVVLGEIGEEDDEPYLPDATAISAGGAHSCEIDHDGPVRCWGDNGQGQLGVDEGAVFGRVVSANFGASH